MDSAGPDSAGTDSAGTDSAGTDSAGTDSAGTGSAGLRSLLALASCLAVVLTTGACSASAPEALVTVAASSGQAATATASPSASQGQASRLRTKYSLTGMDLPDDWPDVPVPHGTRVVSAYAIGDAPNRTWSASFVGPTTTAADKMAAPVVKALKSTGFTPVSQYLDPADSNSGLYSLRSSTLSVYIVLGELDGHPNTVMTVRQRGKSS